MHNNRMAHRHLPEAQSRPPSQLDRRLLPVARRNLHECPNKSRRAPWNVEVNDEAVGKPGYECGLRDRE